MRLALTLAIALLASPALAADPGAEAARSYRLEAAALPAALQVGAEGALSITITPLEKTHVHPQAPLKVTLASTAGLAVAKAALGRGDLADPKAEAPAFKVPFKATAAGAQAITAKVDFFICSDQWCVKQVREVKVAVDVK
ncbi:MAG: hypothetical protein NDI82_10775 [Anaeromyxobacteraceae bacterium]|nr:hypothetical protein [Anaeromyxobacteraceae bacterium]